MYYSRDTYVQFEGLHGGSIGPRNRSKESQHLLDDTVQVLQADNGVEPQFCFWAEAAVVKETPGSQFLPQALKDLRVAEELHDKGGACAGSGGKGSKDQLNG